jgi:hypothetical protein
MIHYIAICYDYVKMTRFLTIKNLLFYRLYIGVWLRSVHDRRFSVWSITTYLRRCLHGCKTQPRNLFPNMGGCIVVELRLQWSSELFLLASLVSCYVTCSLFRLWFGTAVCILTIQRPGVILKAPFIEKTQYHDPIIIHHNINSDQSRRPYVYLNLIQNAERTKSKSTRRLGT